MRSQRGEKQALKFLAGAETSLPFLFPSHPTDLSGLRDLLQIIWINDRRMFLTNQFILILSKIGLCKTRYTCAPCDIKRRYSSW